MGSTVKHRELGQHSYKEIMEDMYKTVKKIEEEGRDYYYIGIVLIPNDTSKEYIPKFSSRLSEYNRHTDSVNIKFYTPGYIRTEQKDSSNYDHINGDWYFDSSIYEEFTEKFDINGLPIKEQLDGSGVFIIDFKTFLKLFGKRISKNFYIGN